MDKPYPTLEEVEKADVRQLTRWALSLKSPGYGEAADRDRAEFAEVLYRIIERFYELSNIPPPIL